MKRHLCLAILLGAGCGEIVPSVPDSGAAGEASVDAGPGSTADPTPDPTTDPCEPAACDCSDEERCGPHQVCDTSPGSSRACTCTAGYVDSGGGCVWGMVPPDPSFQDQSRWQRSGGASVQPMAEGDMAPGQAFFDAAAVCALGSVHQTVQMPPHGRAEPFVATVNYRSLGTQGELVGVAVGLGGAWRELPASSDWQEERLCLGESAYGGAVELRVAPAQVPYTCPEATTTGLAVDHMVIEPAAPGECPAPGQVRNADFEGIEGWTGTGEGDGHGVIEAGAGARGTRAGRLSTRTMCSSAALSGLASWPTAGSVPSAAVALWWMGTSGRELHLHTGGQPIARLVGSGTARTSRVCLPPWAQGLPLDLTWSLPGTSGACTRMDVRDFYIDDIRVVSEPACGSNPHLLDGGFELTEGSPLQPAWRLQAPPARGRAAIVSDTSQAHGGAGYARLELFMDCASATAETTVMVPRPEGGDGPALRFWHNVADNPETSFYPILGKGLDQAPGRDALPEGGGWAQATVCLPPGMAGRPLPIAFRLDAGDGSCTHEFPGEVALIDDVELTTDPRCPAGAP